MKRFRFVLALAVLTLLAVFCAPKLPPTVDPVAHLFAQSVPTTVVFSWSPNPSTENVVSYVTGLDTGPAQTQPLTVCTPTKCTVTLTVTSFGAHTATVAGQNQKVSTDGTTLQTGAVSSLAFTLNPLTSAPTGVAVKGS